MYYLPKAAFAVGRERKQESWRKRDGVASAANSRPLFTFYFPFLLRLDRIGIRFCARPPWPDLSRLRLRPPPQYSPFSILFYGSTCPSRSRAINTACKRLSITATLRRYAPVRERELHQLCHGRRACRLSTVSARLSLENSHHQARQDENRPCLSFHFMVR